MCRPEVVKNLPGGEESKAMTFSIRIAEIIITPPPLR